MNCRYARTERPRIGKKAALPVCSDSAAELLPRLRPAGDADMRGSHGVGTVATVCKIRLAIL